MDGREKKGNIRHPAVAGPHSFYPSDPQILRRIVTDYLQQAELKIDKVPFGLIAPHAGYVYSGPVAGWAYRQVQGRTYRSVIVMAPSHMIPIRYISVMSSGIYITPLGEIQIDEELAQKLIDAGGDSIRASTSGHLHDARTPAEHSLEVQLPFLQVALGDFKIVPVIIGGQDWKASRDLGEALVKAASEDVLIVASSDLSHYHGYEEAYRLDGEVIELIERMDAEAIANGCSRNKLEACGSAPISALLFAADKKGARNVEILRHKTSGDIPGGMRDQVVGYLAAAVYYGEEWRKDKDTAQSEMKAQTGSGLTFTLEEQKYLLELARQSVSEALYVPFQLTKPDVKYPILSEKRGLFVTIKIGGRLRGCIGNLSPTEPLGELVKKVALQTAFDDPRFQPMTEKELDSVTFEITVLGEMARVRSSKEIVVGRHGILIKRGYNQGLLLPQVAVEMGWNREQFLEGVCQKAGLPPDAWRKKDTQINIFTADLFGEA